MISEPETTRKTFSRAQLQKNGVRGNELRLIGFFPVEGGKNGGFGLHDRC